MHFLIVNDDGINSPFLPILTQAVKRAGHRVTVCVPATQQSAKAHAFSIEQPILAEKREVPDADEAWAIFGTPVDSCRIGAMNLAPDADAVISGINLGYNVGMSCMCPEPSARRGKRHSCASRALPYPPRSRRRTTRWRTCPTGP